MSRVAAVSGVLLLDKPRGLTSQQAVSRVKRLYAAARAGHTGTLDPMAEGLLPVGLGEATKYSRFLLEADKTYLARLQLGLTTSTGDAEGEPLRRRAVAVSAAQLEAVLARFRGALQQRPPMHSALKVAGRPLYAYARAGQTLQRSLRSVFINHLQVIDFKEEILDIRVDCSKGTYIRVLAEDIGEALGCGAHLAALQRIATGGYRLEQAVSLSGLEVLSPAERLRLLRPVEAFAAALPELRLDAAESARIRNGQRLATDLAPGFYRLYDPSGAFLGVGEAGATGLAAARLTAAAAPKKAAGPLSDKPLNC